MQMVRENVSEGKPGQHGTTDCSVFQQLYSNLSMSRFVSGVQLGAWPAGRYQMLAKQQQPLESMKRHVRAAAILACGGLSGTSLS
jgi:hypothetical protein